LLTHPSKGGLGAASKSQSLLAMDASSSAEKGGRFHTPFLSSSPHVSHVYLIP